MTDLRPWLKLTIQRMRFGLKKQQAFLENISVLVSDGVPPNHAIDMLAKISLC